jgi:N-methylhydantoinase B
LNSNKNTSRSVCRLVFKMLTTPNEPANEGHFRMVDLVVPEDSIFNAKRPSATLPGFFALEALEDVVKRALAEGMPDRVNAEEYGRCCPAHLKFRDADGGYRILADTEGGGWGGKPFEDGENALLFGEIRVIPIEIMESRYPVLLRQYRLRENSGGPGRFRGGLGVIKQYEMLADCELNAGFDRQVCPPDGVLGGHGSVKNVVAILDEDGGRVELPSKITDYRVRQGQLISFETAGGGGYGDPGERDLEHVEADLRGGYITPGEQLEDAYRVVLDEAGEIDASATADRRAAAVLHE